MKTDADAEKPLRPSSCTIGLFSLNIRYIGEASGEKQAVCGARIEIVWKAISGSFEFEIDLFASDDYLFSHHVLGFWWRCSQTLKNVHRNAAIETQPAKYDELNDWLCLDNTND